MLRRPKLMLLITLASLILFWLAGCTPTGMRDLKNTVADSATLAAVVVETQPVKSTPLIAKPTQKPTGNATNNAAPIPTTGKRVPNTPGDFDFYVLSLSWSPDFCASNDDPQQCSVGRKLGFVLHGLWPQYTRGYPADCSNVPLSRNVQQQFPNLYPSASLSTHEWAKHGTCSGLTPVDYMALAKTLKESIVIPPAYRQPATAFRSTVDDLKASFVEANSGLSEDALAVQCSGSGRFLQELRVCFSREGQPIACSREVQNDVAKSCGNADFLVRNVK